MTVFIKGCVYVWSVRMRVKRKDGKQVTKTNTSSGDEY